MVRNWLHMRVRYDPCPISTRTALSNITLFCRNLKPWELSSCLPTPCVARAWPNSADGMNGLVSPQGGISTMDTIWRKNLAFVRLLLLLPSKQNGLGKLLFVRGNCGGFRISLLLRTKWEKTCKLNILSFSSLRNFPYVTSAHKGLSWRPANAQNVKEKHLSFCGQKRNPGNTKILDVIFGRKKSTGACTYDVCTARWEGSTPKADAVG